MIPTVGRIVHFTINEYDAEQINRRRDDAYRKLEWHREHKTGAQVHVGNVAEAGHIYPLLITRVWSGPDGPTPETLINGQVFLDGNDSYWVTSVKQGDGSREWHEPPRV